MTVPKRERQTTVNFSFAKHKTREKPDWEWVNMSFENPLQLGTLLAIVESLVTANKAFLFHS